MEDKKIANPQQKTEKPATTDKPAAPGKAVVYPSGVQAVNENIEYTITGKSLIIKIVDITKDYGPSSSGKTHIVASTHGNVYVGDTGLMFGLNVNQKTPKK